MAEDVAGDTPTAGRARLWDGPTRLFHWLIVVLVGAAWYTAETGNLEWHRWCGYGVLGLVVFRLYWGVFGAESARFSSFVKGPGATLAYMGTLGSRKPSHARGHNPLGAWSVVAILVLLAAEVGFGLFAVDVDGIESGPLSNFVDFDTGRLLAKLHHWTFTGLQILVVLHVAAVIFYLAYKRENLIGAMITGRRNFPIDPKLRFAPWWTLILGVVIAAAVAWFVAKGLKI
jgi:cytochrome b